MKKYLITTLIAFNLYSVSYSTNSLPDVESQSGLLTSKYQTPLQKDAQIFVQSWNEIEQKDALSADIISFVNNIIASDNLSNFQHISEYNFSLFNEDLSRQPLTVDLDSYRFLYKHWKKSIDNQSPNAFTSYIIGYLNSPFCDLNLEIQDVKVDFKTLLAAASRKHYLRATHVLLERSDWRLESITSELLEQRKIFFEKPDESVFSFVSSHCLRSEVQAKDLVEFSELIGQVSQNQKQYEILKDKHISLTNLLTNDFILRKSKPTAYRTELFDASNSINASALSITVGITNLDSNYKTGIAQIASGAMNLMFSLIPYGYNWWYQPRGGHLLPSWYSNDEIALQSDVIALAFVINNYERLLNEATPLKMKDYRDKIVHGVLSRYQDMKASLCSTITSQEVEFMSARVGS